jgi:hypothetical protein
MQLGHVIDNRFELIELAGSGGMGTVYRAADRSSGTSRNARWMGLCSYKPPPPPLA